MNDDFLYRLRKAPPPEFAERLKARLDLQGPPAPEPQRSLRLPTLIALLLCGSALAFISPSVRHTVVTLVERFEAKPEPVATPSPAAPAAPAPQSVARTPMPVPREDVDAVVAEPAKPLAASAPARARRIREYVITVGSPTSAPYVSQAINVLHLGSRRVELQSEFQGSEEGIWRFCGGNEEFTPDIAQTLRKMLPNERERCSRNRVAFLELKLGHDALVLARARNSLPLDLTQRVVYRALAEQVPEPDIGSLMRNPYATWQQIDARLPADRIEVVGPPVASQSYAVFAERVFGPGCRTDSWIQIQYAQFIGTLCHTLRKDGAYLEMPEMSDVILQRIESSQGAVGVIPYALFQRNAERLVASSLEGVAPSPETITSERYPAAAPVYLYVKKAHIGPGGPVPMGFIRELVSERAIGPKGYLTLIGLVPLPEAERAAQREALQSSIGP